MSDLSLVRKRKPGARARRLAVHSEDVLDAAVRTATLRDALEGAARVAGFTARARRFGPKLAPFDAAAVASLRASAARGRVALVFGNEQSGLADADVRLCDDLYCIRAADARPIFNLAQSVLLVAHALAFPPSRAASGVRSARTGSRAHVDPLMAEWTRLLRRLGYPAPAAPHDRSARIEQRLEKHLLRACLDADDAQLWRGLLRRLHERFPDRDAFDGRGAEPPR